MTAIASATRSKRLSREDFLARALEVLSNDGESELRIDRLVAAIGVTKGSFYWHFENRAEFVQSLAEYWKHWSTDRVLGEIKVLKAEPKRLLFKIQEIVTRGELSRYDLVMRSWATHEPEVAKIVRSVDEARYGIVRRLFERLGYQGEELHIRASTYVVSTAFWSATNPRESRKLSLKRLSAVLDILIGSG